MDKSLLSANFKKDYVAYSAIVIFFLIISFEIFMAIFIPAHLEMQDIWSEEVARQDMINNFDYTRNTFLSFKSKREDAEEEAEVIVNSLTSLADYLREYQYQITMKEINDIAKSIEGLPALRNYLLKRGAHSIDLKLKPEKFIAVLKKEMAKTK